MRETRKVSVTAAVTALMVLIAFVLHVNAASLHPKKDQILVGLICDGDQSTPYSENFVQALSQVQAAYGNAVKTDIRCNITEDNCGRVIDDLVSKGAALIITNSYGFGTAAKQAAERYPDVQFVQAAQINANEDPFCTNYHTFMGRIYEGRYIAGQAAGRKLKELIDNHVISEEQAVCGYVGAYEVPEVISGFTAFYLGVKNQCPSAVMKVRFTDAWTSYQKEYDTAARLIDEGCVIISQHSDTTGPAVACADARSDHPVFHVGYNTSMISTAPLTTLISTKIEWTPYLSSAVEAVLNGYSIESRLNCDKHGNDAGGGLKEGWVRMLQLNKTIAAKGTQAMIDQSINGFKEGRIEVFKGDYNGVDPQNPSDRINLKNGYQENAESSAPTFHYIIDGITLE